LLPAAPVDYLKHSDDIRAQAEWKCAQQKIRKETGVELKTQVGGVDPHCNNELVLNSKGAKANMGSSYIPSKDAQASIWMQTFAGGISASPATYQLAVADATTISNALMIASDPATRTPGAIATKVDLRKTAEAICRQYAMIIKLNNGISDEAKIGIGVRPVNPNRSPVTVPESSPLLNVLGATPGSHTVRYGDAITDKPAKPFGASQLQLFVTIAAEATTDEDTAQYYGSFTKNPVAVGFAPDDDGKVATYFARWISRRGEVGPWSLPVSMRIAA
jgi:hypothetical protein